MNMTKIDPTISMLFLMSDEELVQLATEHRQNIQLVKQGFLLTINIHLQNPICDSGDYPEAVFLSKKADLLKTFNCDSLNLLGGGYDVVTAEVLLKDIVALSENADILYISAMQNGRPYMNRTRSEIGADIIDGQYIRNGTTPWNGHGVVVGVVDSGIDLRHPAFRQFPGGPTRIEWLWDRSVSARTGETVGDGGIGVIYSRVEIDNFLLGAAVTPPIIPPEVDDFDGHGTHVTAIAAGSANNLKGIASGAAIIFVRYRIGDIGQIHTLTNWIFSRANGPCSINISLGNNAGSHDGTSDVERELDASLRNPTTLSPRAGRFIAAAAGNERQKIESITSFVLPIGRPNTQLAWISPNNNRGTDEMEFWYPGLDLMAVRIISPIASGNRISYWVDPDPAGCIERECPGGFAPTAAGPAPTKRFDFANNTVIIISQAVNPNNRDRQIVIRIQSPSGSGIIQAGNWILEFQGRNDLPGGGRLHGYIRDNVSDAVADSNFAPATNFARQLKILPQEEKTLFLGLDFLNGPADAELLIEYPLTQQLEICIQPPRENSSHPSAWVGYKNTITAAPNTIVPGDVGPSGLLFSFADNQIININHDTVNNCKRVTLKILQRRVMPPPNDPPQEVIYTLRMRAVNQTTMVPVNVLSNITSEFANAFRILDQPNLKLPVTIYPDTCIPAVSRLVITNSDLFQTGLQIVIPGGAFVKIRIRIPPLYSKDETGWTFTPWIGPNNTEIANFEALSAHGNRAVGKKIIYHYLEQQVTINYPAPKVNKDSVITITLAAKGNIGLTTGIWLVEYMGSTITDHLEIVTELHRQIENIKELEQLQPQSYDLKYCFLSGSIGQKLSLPFSILDLTVDSVQIELQYHQQNELHFSLQSPDGHLSYWVGPNNSLHETSGINPVVNANDVTGTLCNGTVVTINTSTTVLYGKYIRALFIIHSPIPRPVFHPKGTWLLIVKAVNPGVERKIIARIQSDGNPASWVVHDTRQYQAELGTLSSPGTSREVMTVANMVPGFAPVTVPAASSSAGPVRTASQMSVKGNHRWVNYQKPEISAPGTGILSACSGSNALWFSHANERWNAYHIRDGLVLGMRASWPFLSNGQRTHTQFIPASMVTGTLTEIHYNIVIPSRAGHSARLELRYSEALDFTVRVSQPANATAPNKTHAVNSAGKQMNVSEKDVAVGFESPIHPDGQGQIYRTNDQTQIIIRQNGSGKVTILLERIHEYLAYGKWQITVQHNDVLPTATKVTLEAFPEIDSAGWPGFSSDNRTNAPIWPAFAHSLPPRQTATIGQATDRLNPFLQNYSLAVSQSLVADVSIRFSYPVGDHNFEILVLTPNETQHTQSINSQGKALNISGSRPVHKNIVNGARYQFTSAAGDANGNIVSIEHNDGLAIVTLSRGISADFKIAPGNWNIRFLNRSQTLPPEPITITAELESGPHDAPYFPLANGLIPYQFKRHQNLETGKVVDWDFRVPPGRHHDQELELIYDARDTLELQVNIPDGDRTDPILLNNETTANPSDSPLHAQPNPAAPEPRQFHQPGQYVIEINHTLHAQSTLRNHIRITIKADSDNPIPEGLWQLRINPTAISAGSHGMTEGFIVEMQEMIISGTSMATPHIAGLAALMLQQDKTQSHVDIKQRILESATPSIITHQASTKLANHWHPVTGWGMVNAASSLLRHWKRIDHGSEAVPAVSQKVTGCPVNCADNCLVEPRIDHNQLIDLIISDRAPYSQTANDPSADPYPGCPCLSDYVRHINRPVFRGGESANLITLKGTAIDQPLIRNRNQRGSLNGFQSTSWNTVYAELANRFVEQWSSTDTIVVLEGIPDTGLIKELLFNRFVHYLQALLTASNNKTNCSFTTQKKVKVVGARSPISSPFHAAGHKALNAFLNNQKNKVVSRCDVSLSKSVIIWGTNLPANASGLWNTILANSIAREGDMQIFVIGPGLLDLPDHIHRISISSGTDRTLALALMLRIIGNLGHRISTRQIPQLTGFSDATHGIEQFLNNESLELADFMAHVRSEAETYLTLSSADATVIPDTGLTDIVLPGADAAGLSQFRQDFDALISAFYSGQVATIIGGGVTQNRNGEEHVQYIAALSFLSGNAGIPGGGISFGEDMHLQFNDNVFAQTHHSRRPEQNISEGTVSFNLTSLTADAPGNSNICLWFDLNPISYLSDTDNIQRYIGRTQLNIQVTHTLDDSSCFADIILPVADTLHSWDLQMGARSPYINFTQAIQTYDEAKNRPFVRVLHELVGHIHTKLNDRFHDDLTPTIDDDIYKTGPLLLPRTRRTAIAEFINNSNSIPNLLVDQFPQHEIANMHNHIREWYQRIHGDQPITDTDQLIEASNWIQFFDRMQVDWILEVLLSKYNQTDAMVTLYQLLQRGTTHVPEHVDSEKYSLNPDGTSQNSVNVARSTLHVNLEGINGFQSEQNKYCNFN